MNIVAYIFLFLVFTSSFRADDEIDKIDNNPITSGKSELNNQEIHQQMLMQQQFEPMMSSQEGIECKKKLQCYKCCVGDGVEDACIKYSKNWKKGEDCNCE